MVSCQNSVPNVFMATPIDVVVFKCRKICLTGNQWNRALFAWQTKKMLAASQTVTTEWIAPKICQGEPQTVCSQCCRFYPNLFTFGRVI